MSDFAAIMERAKTDRVFYANLLVDPQKALADANISIDDDAAEVTRLELLVRAGQSQLSAAGALVGIDVGFAELDWGIGAGCCNGALLLPGANFGRIDATERRAPR